MVYTANFPGGRSTLPGWSRPNIRRDAIARNDAAKAEFWAGSCLSLRADALERIAVEILAGTRSRIGVH